MNTIIDFEATEKSKTKTCGGMGAAGPKVLAELAKLIDKGELGTEIAEVCPLNGIRDTFRELEARHTRGKIVLQPRYLKAGNIYLDDRVRCFSLFPVTDRYLGIWWQPGFRPSDLFRRSFPTARA